MRHLIKSKILAVSVFSGLMLVLAANPAKAGDLSIGIGFNLGYPGYHNSYYPDSYVIHYRDYDRHRHGYNKHWKHHKKHWKHHDRHYRGHGKHHYRSHDRHSYRHDRRYDRDYRDHRYYR